MVSGPGPVRDGTPLPGAVLDVWQADDQGFYDVQQPDVQPAGNGRGLFTADDRGPLLVPHLVPAPYPIPTDGPVGDLLRADRPAPLPARAHPLHRRAPKDTRPVTTHIFVAGSDYLDSDAVFAVKQSLVQDFAETDDPSLARGVRHPEPVPARALRPRAGAGRMTSRATSPTRPGPAGRPAARRRRDRDPR